MQKGTFQHDNAVVAKAVRIMSCLIIAKRSGNVHRIEEIL